MTTNAVERPKQSDTTTVPDDEPKTPTKSTETSNTPLEDPKVGSRDAPGG